MSEGKHRATEARAKFPQTWITDEKPPRQMIVKGVSAVDSDCFVANFKGKREPHWIIRHSGYVVGLKGEKPVYARAGSSNA